MKIRLEQYRLVRLPCNELGVLAAFLKFPCVYGVSGSWIKNGHGSLEERTLIIARELERKGLILAEPGGIVRMEGTFYGLLSALGHPMRLCRVCWGAEDGPACIYLHRVRDGVITIEQDGKGGCHLGRIWDREGLLAALTEAEELPDSRKVSGGFQESWLGALVFEKKDGFCTRLLDYAWSREPGLAEGWERVCRVLWDGAAGGKEQDG